MHIGNLIKQVVRKQQLTDNQFGQMIGLTRDGVQKIYPKEFLDTELLNSISRVLNHDFFTYFSRELSTVQEQNPQFGQVTHDDLNKITALLYRLNERLDEVEKHLPQKKKAVKGYSKPKTKKKK